MNELYIFQQVSVCTPTGVLFDMSYLNRALPCAIAMPLQGVGPFAYGRVHVNYKKTSHKSDSCDLFSSTWRLMLPFLPKINPKISLLVKNTRLAA